ncbi:MAG: TIGR03619 family F420-dependent LLM class oxidoreductase [Myxococcota bacterium]
MKFAIAAAYSDPGELLALARAADASGWEAIAVSDHVAHPESPKTPYPYTPDGSRRWPEFTSWPDPWVAIGAMAAVTERLRFFTNVFVLPMRNPFVVAKAVGTAAVMSRNRVALGVGVGWSRDEFELLEQDFATRGRRTDEMIEVMRKLWSGRMVEHRGEFYDFERLEMSPAPKVPVPIYFGGVSEPALRRVARLGDGWISDIHSTEALRLLVAKLRGYRAEAGRAAAPLAVIASANDAFDVDGYRRLEDAGVTYLMTMPWFFYGGPTLPLAQKLDSIARFADDVIAKMR